MNRLARLAVVGGIAIAASAPLAPPASAMRCAEGFEFICHTLALVCSHVPEGGKYDLHDILCTSLA